MGEDEDGDTDEELRTLFDFPLRYKGTMGLGLGSTDKGKGRRHSLGASVVCPP